MNRWLRGTLTLTLVLGVLGVARADIVYFQDRAAKKEDEHRGTITEENPAGVTIKLKDGKTHQVPAGIITRVQYDSKEVSAVDYRRPFGKEQRAREETDPKRRSGFLNEALEGYSKLQRELSGVPAAKRYLQYKVAEVTALQSQDDPAKAEAAIKLLNDFRSAHPTSWQITGALKTLARLQEEAGKLDEARKAYEELADLPDIPAAMKQESGILVGKLLLRAGKYGDAEGRLKKLAAGMSADDPQSPFVKAYVVESEIGQGKLDTVPKTLTEVIKGNSDPRLRGLAYNLMGDYYRKRGQDDEAFWQYLRVDAQYGEDTEETAKALYWLAKLFDKVKKDPIRGKDCSGRLLDKRFLGTAYQRLWMQESKKSPGE